MSRKRPRTPKPPPPAEPLAPATPEPRRAFRVRRLLAFGFVACAALGAYLVASQIRSQKLLEADSLVVIRAQADKAAGVIGAEFREAADLAETLARELADGSLAFADIESRMKSAFESRPTLDGLAITFEPFAYDGKQRLYQEYVHREADDSLGVLKVATYDYTKAADDPKAPKTDWYRTPLAVGPTWNEPFLATGAGKYLIEYAVPFRAKGGAAPAGVVTADFGLRDARQIVSRLDIGSSGFGILFSAKGTFLAHPDPKLIAKGSIFDHAGKLGEEATLAARSALAGVPTEADCLETITGQDAWLVFRPVPATGGAIGLVMCKSEFRPPAREMLRAWVTAALPCAGAAVFALALVVRVGRGGVGRLWALAVGFSAVCASLVVLTWVLAWHFRDPDGVPVTNRAVVGRHVERFTQSLKRMDRPHLIPTGVQWTSITFPDSASVTVGGHVWQRFDATTPEGVARGFGLPQQVGDGLTIEEVQRVKEAGEEVVVYRVAATLQQSFDPVLFPFDQREVLIRLEPAELDANVMLVPDLGAYPVLTPAVLPGIDGRVRLNNWSLGASFFSYRVYPQASLGLASRAERGEVPVLRFMIDARRNFIGPFIAYLVPALVAAALTFALMMGGQEFGSRDHLLTGLSYVAALFFVVVVAHTALRDSVAAVGVTYLEHFYILLYGIITLVVLNAFLVARDNTSRLVRFNENLIPRLLFWPVYTGALTVSTLITFVYG